MPSTIVFVRCWVLRRVRQVVAQPGAGAVGGALKDERDVGVARGRRGQGSGQRDRHRGAAAVVVRRGDDVRARHVEERGEREHEPGGGEQLHEPDAGSVRATEPEQRDHLKPDEPDRGPSEPSRSEVAGQAAQRGRRHGAVGRGTRGRRGRRRSWR